MLLQGSRDILVRFFKKTFPAWLFIVSRLCLCSWPFLRRPYCDWWQWGSCDCPPHDRIHSAMAKGDAWGVGSITHPWGCSCCGYWKQQYRRAWQKYWTPAPCLSIIREICPRNLCVRWFDQWLDLIVGFATPCCRYYSANNEGGLEDGWRYCCFRLVNALYVVPLMPLSSHPCMLLSL